MATVKFYTRTQDDKLATLHLRYVEGTAVKLRLALPKMLFPSYWDAKRQALTKNILGSKELTLQDALDIEAGLRRLRDAILLSRDKLTEAPTGAWLRGVVDDFYCLNARKSETLNQYIERFISEAEAGKRLCTVGNTRKKYSYGSTKNFRDFQHSFDLYQGIEKPAKKKKKEPAKKKDKQPYKPLNWDDITVDFYNDFVNYFYSRNCSGNYIGKHLKTFKTIIRQAREEGFPVNKEIDRKAFKVISDPVDSIYLTEVELSRLFKLDLSNQKHLEIARDVFLIGCYTAQRYSDYSRINKNNIKQVGDNKYIELIQQKTGEKCIIPISPECDAILKRYDYNLPKTYEQKINDRIKTIGSMAEINEVIHYEQNRGGLTVKKKEFKYNMIKTHTARRTGCTLMFLAGIPTITIMKVSGHKTEKEFLKYIKVTKEQTAVNLASHPYFSGLRVAN